MAEAEAAPALLTWRSMVFASIHAPPRDYGEDEALAILRHARQALIPTGNLTMPPVVDDRLDSFAVRGVQGRQGRLLQIGHQDESPHLLVECTWPGDFEEYAGVVDDLHGLALGHLPGLPAAILVEARLRAQVRVPDGVAGIDALRSFFAEGETRLTNLGDPTFLSLKFETAPLGDIHGPFDAPFRDVQIEPLREDPQLLYLDVMSNWGAQRVTLQPGVSGAGISAGPGPLTEGVELPSAYLANVRTHVEEAVLPFLGGPQ